MNKRVLAAAAAAAVSLTAPAVAKSDRNVAAADYSVYVDKPTGFVFVKLPAGWKFVGHVGKDQLGQLPSGVHTTLLKPERAAQARVKTPRSNG